MRYNSVAGGAGGGRGVTMDAKLAAQLSDMSNMLSGLKQRSYAGQLASPASPHRRLSH